MNLCWKLWIYLTLKVRVQNFPNQTRRSRDVCSAETNFVNVFVSSLLPLMCNFFPVKILGFSLESRSTFDIYYRLLKEAVGFFKWYCNWKKIIIFKKTYIYVVLYVCTCNSQQHHPTLRSEPTTLHISSFPDRRLNRSSTRALC